MENKSLNNRADIRDFIIQMENQFSVNNWKVNAIHLWPVIRIQLYFYLVQKVEFEQKNKTENKKSKSFLEKVKNKTKKEGKKLYSKIYNTFFFSGKFNTWLNKLPNKKYLFVAFDGHRVDYKENRFNKYFDVFIEDKGIQEDYFYYEYDDSFVTNQYKKENVYRFNEYLKNYVNTKNSNTNVVLEGYQDFISYLQSNAITTSFAERFNIEQIKIKAADFVKKVAFFKEILKAKDKIEQVLILCYYSEKIMALVTAANQLGIKTIEYQHGPQSDIHMAYSNWSAIPSEGYDALPETFWNWNKESSEIIQYWANKSKRYKTLVTGNFWVDFWKRQNEKYQFEDYILYSLQTFPYTIEDFFHPNIIKTIKESNKLWMIRLHPRGLEEKEKIKEFLKLQGLEKNVNIEQATNDPLPLLLSKAILHVTYYSGTTIEAEMFNIKTVFLGEEGALTFPYLIENNKAFLLPVQSDTFEEDFLKIMNKNILE